jgi:hypothetical protein
MGLPDAAVVVQAVRATFERRNTHAIPLALPDPPVEWHDRYTVMASECGASRREVSEAAEYVSTYWLSLQFTDTDGAEAD